MPAESPRQHGNLPHPHPAPNNQLYQWARLLSAAYLTFAILAASAAILFILRHHTRIPFGDYWNWLDRYYRNGLLSALYAQANEHRVIVPGLFYFLDHRYLGGTNDFLTAALVVIQIGCMVLLAAPLWRCAEIARPVRYVFAGFVAIVMLWFIQGEVFFYPFQICIPSANLGILAALHLFARLPAGRPARTARWIALWAGLVGSAVWATFSFGHGMVLWPVMLVAGLALRLPARWIAMICAAFLCAAAAYFAGYHSPVIHPITLPGVITTSPLDALFHRPLKVARYVVLMLGLPFFGLGPQDVGIYTHLGAYAVTIAGIAVGAALAVRMLLRRGSKSRAEIVYGSLLLVSVGSAGVAALGRSNYPLWQALSGRYAPIPLLFWIAVAALVTLELSRLEPPGFVGRMLWSALLILASLATLSTQIPTGSYMAGRERQQQAAAVSIAVGVPDEQAIRAELTDPAMVRSVDRAATRSLGHSMFARPESALLGTPLLGHFHLAPSSACLGFFDQAAVLPPPSGPGVKLIGWAWDRAGHRDAARIWVTDEQMVIRGFGIAHVARPDVADANSDIAMRQAGWIAYAQLPATVFRIFAGLGRSTVCEIVGQASRPVQVRPPL